MQDVAVTCFYFDFRRSKRAVGDEYTGCPAETGRRRAGMVPRETVQADKDWKKVIGGRGP